MDKFATDQIEKEMKRLQGNPNDSDLSQMDEEGEHEMEEGSFFGSEEDLEEVEVEDDEEGELETD